MKCFGNYNRYSGLCYTCNDEHACERYTKANKGGDNMLSNNYGRKSETSEERKERLDQEWLIRLPCYTCHPKMQRLCKHYNTFKRPDYNHEQFKLGKIICNDHMEQPTPIATTNCDGTNFLIYK